MSDTLDQDRLIALLEDDCARCDGRGYTEEREPDGHTWECQCDWCRQGKVPSRFGEAVLDMVMWHIRITPGRLR